MLHSMSNVTNGRDCFCSKATDFIQAQVNLQCLPSTAIFGQEHPPLSVTRASVPSWSRKVNMSDYHHLFFLLLQETAALKGHSIKKKNMHLRMGLCDPQVTGGITEPVKADV